MNYYSKSKFVLFHGCKKRLWLEKYKKEEKLDVFNEQVLITGNKVGDLAMNLFGDYYLAETPDNDLMVQVENTKSAISQGENVICEAAFFFQNNYCAVDILKRNDDDTFSIYEVKSTTGVEKHYIYDLAYQYYVLHNSNIKIKSLNLVYINSDYILKDSFDINEYFKIEDLTSLVKPKLSEVKEMLDESDSILNNNEEMKSILSANCNKNGGCPFLPYCKKNNCLPDVNNTYDLYNNRSKYKQITSGILTFEDLLVNKCKLSDIQKRQIDYAINNKDDIYLEKENIKAFLDTFTYPLYFLDFETFQEAIPTIKGSKPYQQIPFQYSLHILYEDGKLEHKEYLGDGINDPILGLIQNMLSDLETSGTIVSYNDSFERTRIKEMAYMYPKYKSKLFDLDSRFVDLADVFQKGYCYNKAMGGSFSIKSVLPALFPNDPSLDYHSLNDVHKGDEASKAYLELSKLDKESYDRIRNSLLAYCKLDTYAMVKIYYKLLELIGD
jgi:hypothetical protein